MSADIVDLAQARIDRSPHGSGPAKCLHCGHTWVAVVQIGVVGFPCPECHLDKGVMTGLYSSDKYDWACACGNILYRISEKRIYCVLCGKEPDLA